MLSPPIGCTIADMPNIAAVLKGEIARIARKEMRGETVTLKKAVAAYRSEIAALKRRAQALERQLRGLTRGTTTSSTRPLEIDDLDSGKLRFSAKGLASQRRRLNLSARELGLLLGTSAQSVYNWEEGKARPRASHLKAIAALRNLGKKQAASIIESRGG